MGKRCLIVLGLFIFLGACAKGDGVYHQVRSGQTLYQISRSYQVDERYLARINGIHNPAQLKAGDTLFIPGATRIQSVPATAGAGNAPAASPSRETPAPPRPSLKKNQVQAKNGKGEGTTPPEVPVKGKFIYPVKGKIIKRFGQSEGSISKGLEISIPPGTAVLSSAAGQVIYSGNGVRGYGNLIILKHDDSYYTVYGFNQKNLVEAGAFVGQGDKIALSGHSPNGGHSSLHFEIRYGKKAVDPTFYLP